MKTIHLILLLFISMPAQAEIMLLIHGYLGDASSWEKSGINEELHQQGWLRAGMFRGSPQGPQLFVTKNTAAEKLVYVAELPSEAPIMVQADILFNIINAIQQKHPQQQLIRLPLYP